jgi:uncharacterized protein (TIGR02145 family)
MKNLITHLLSIFMILLAIVSCSDNLTGGDGNEKPTLEKAAELLNVQQGAWQSYRNSLQETGDTLAALEAMGNWIGDNPAVEDAWYHDLETIEIKYKNGLKSYILIIPTDENGIHLNRGGSAGNVLKQFSFKENNQPRKIKNDKVLILIPYTEQFQYYDSRISELRESFSKGDQKLEVDIIKDKEVGLDDINRMGDYGFIILNTHGLKNGFLLSGLRREFEKTDPWFTEDWSPEKVRQELLEPYNIPLEKIEIGEIVITQNIDLKTKKNHGSDGPVEYEVVVFSLSILITDNYIRNADINLEDAVVFGNHCYSGHTADGSNTNNMPEAWRSKGAVAYYGYSYDNGISRTVENEFALAMEKLLIKRLVQDTDTTGVSHLKDDGSRYNFESTNDWFYFRAPKRVKLTPSQGQTKIQDPFYFNHYFDTDYTYEPCGTFTDPRDGQEYQSVCIGEQVWMAENLNFKSDESWCYADNPNNCETYGRLYSSESVKTACPPGWHLPSVEEYEELNDYFPKNMAGGELKSVTGWNEPNTGANNNSGWSALPGGHKNLLLDLYMGLGNFGYWWTSTTHFSSNAHRTRYVRLSHNKVILGMAGSGPSDGAEAYSCRCVKD